MFGRVNPRTAGMCALFLWAVLFLPPLRNWFEASMFRHMILQFPLLIAIGWILGRRIAHHPVTGRLQLANRWGATGLLIATATMTLWMLPSTLDSARLDILWDATKFLSVPLLAGSATSLSWYRCPPIARGVIHVEIVATFMRFGWAYLATDERLCLAYLLGDQQRTGTALCSIGAMWGVAAIWRPVFGPARGKEYYVT
ncbi:MAG: hypothetical protein EXR36_02590 [Betaproteobacteria bacterium]|nr:hypothetical protein [Betaproteobacteria bacterium]